jgi:dTDP-4-dehydrorhamnose reductase
VTAWSLFGAFDWASLMTERNDLYEAGAFDVRGRQPRATALASLIRQLAAGREPRAAEVFGVGWWRRPSRLAYPPSESSDGPPTLAHGSSAARRMPSVILVGPETWFARVLERACDERGLRSRALHGAELEGASPEALTSILRELHPWAVIETRDHDGGSNADTETSAGSFPRDSELVAKGCRPDLPLVVLSSGAVFGGGSGPYRESDLPVPCSASGHIQAAAEARVLKAHRGTLLIRAGKLFGPDVPSDPIAGALLELSRGHCLRVPAGGPLSWSHAGDLANTVLDLLIDGERGLWHIAHDEPVTELEFLRLAADAAGFDPALIRPRFSLTAACSPFSSDVILTSERGNLLESLPRAVLRYVRTLGYSPTAAPEDASVKWGAPL